MSKKELSAEQLERLRKLAELPDDQIDTVDIPEIPVENWRYARRPGLYRPVKQPVTLRLDADIVAWFKEHAPEGYQTQINWALRKYVIDVEYAKAERANTVPDTEIRKVG